MEEMDAGRARMVVLLLVGGVLGVWYWCVILEEVVCNTEFGPRRECGSGMLAMAEFCM